MTTIDHAAKPYEVVVRRACKERNLWSVGLIQEAGVVMYIEAIEQLAAFYAFNRLAACVTLSQQDAMMTELIEA